MTAGHCGRILTLPAIVSVAIACATSGGQSAAPVGVADGVRCLYQVRVDDGEREGRVRLVLWEDSQGFRLAASDAIGRSLWIYDQSADEGTWIDRRAESICLYQGGALLEIEDFGHVAADVIPDLLLGRGVELPSEVVLQPLEDGGQLTRDAISVTWREGHCEAGDGSRPSLSRFLEWPQNCAAPAARGE